MSNELTTTNDQTPAVYAAICNVIADLAKTGISKDQTNQHQKYKFRGIDDVYNALAPLLAKHKLCIIPAVGKVDESVVKTRNGEATRVVLYVDYSIACAVDGSKHAASAIGEAMDTSDKAVNKAFTAAWKYLCFQLFAIPTEGSEDADAHSHQRDSSQAPQRPQSKAVDPTLQQAWDNARKVNGKTAGQALSRAAGKQITKGLHEVPADKVAACITALLEVAG